MAANTHGLTTLTFGTPSMTGFVLQNQSLKTSPANVIEVQDENGNLVCARYDDTTTEITLDAVFAGGTYPTVGGTFTINSVKYICTGLEVKSENKGATKVSITGKTSEFITLA
jgi:hypothetical protein